MTLYEEVEKVVGLLSEEEACEFLKGVANDDVVSVAEMLCRGVVRLPREDFIAFIDAALDDEDIVNMMKSDVHFPDSLREEAKSILEE